MKDGRLMGDGFEKQTSCNGIWRLMIFPGSRQLPEEDLEIYDLLAICRVIQKIPHQEYTLTSIFLFGYNRVMRTVWTALMEPNRLHMVELLRDGPLTVGEIADRLGLQQPRVSKHLKVLSEAEIVEVQPQANRRIYQLRREPFQELEAWLQSFRHLWEKRFDRLDTYLSELQATDPDKRNEDEHV